MHDTLEYICYYIPNNFCGEQLGRKYLAPPPWYSVLHELLHERTRLHLDVTPRRVHLHAYERLSRLCAEIQQGRYPTKAALACLVERSPRTVQNDLRALVNDFAAPLKFDRVKNGFYFTDPAWRLPSIVLTEGELISFFAAERVLRRLGASLRSAACP